MKKIYYLFLLIPFSVFAQIPNGYYDSANGLSGYTLKSQLKKIINNTNDGLPIEYFHVDKAYSGLWTGYSTTDRDSNILDSNNNIIYENDNSIIDIYSENPSGLDPYKYIYSTSQCGTYSVEGDCYNREHLIPQSYFGHNNSGPQLSKYLIMKNDIQHVYPTDGKVNGMRNDYPFGKVGNTSTFISKNGSKLGNAMNSGYSNGFSGIVFEPIDEFKGDIARVFFYFATRYEDDMDELYTSYTTVDTRVMFDGSVNKVFSPTFLNILLTWHEQDPVSNKEVKRNNAAFLHQSNRNPFIDHPEYISKIWGSSLSTDNFSLNNKINISPNPSNGVFKIQLDETIGAINLEVYSLLGQKVFEQNNLATQEIEINNLSQGVYLAKFSKNNQVVVKKIIIN